MDLADVVVRALASSANAVLIARNDGCIVWVNEALCRLSGYSAQELVGRTPNVFASGMQDRAFYLDLWETILAGRPWRGQIVERRKDGLLYAVEQVITPVPDEDGRIGHFIAIQSDVHPAREDASRMARLAYHDSLTGLPNRARFLLLLERALAAERAHGHALALMFLDLDRFKEVNDRLGHAIGDQLLVAAAERLSGAVRRSDVVARLGGDEFTVLLTRLAGAADAEPVARQIVARFEAPFSFGDSRRLHASVSIGISVFPQDGGTARALLAAADAAMYRVKARGGRGYAYASAGGAVVPAEHRRGCGRESTCL